MTLDIDLVRRRFPALDPTWVYFDNAGGSQIAEPVLDRMHQYLLTSNVQHGASYPASRLAAERLQEAQIGMATLINARDPSEVVMGSSTTVLLQTLATAFARKLRPGDEVVVSTGDHESNVAPWLELERVGVVVKFWHVNAESLRPELDDLRSLMGARTRLVAVTHVSNILGTINPIREIADAVHAQGALLCVDGVAFAPHRAIDVQATDADFYAFSCYKTFGPHHAVLYGRRELLIDLPSRSFWFVSEDDVPYKFQPGNVNYELSYGMLGLLDYLDELSGVSDTAGVEGSIVGRHTRSAVESSFDKIADHEERLSARLLAWLRDRPSVRIIGQRTADRDARVSMVSFVVRGLPSSEVVAGTDAHRVAIRFGHFYSPRLIERLGLAKEEGVVRVSMVHYNTLDEVDLLTAALDQVVP